MKILIIFLTSVFMFSANSFAQPVGNSLLVRVDERLELLSIACRLAQVKDFSGSHNPFYSKAIDKHFDKYANHPLIKYIGKLKSELDTDSWEIPALAAHLSRTPKLEPLISFDDTQFVDEWESRKLFTPKMVSLLRQFYKETNAQAFFKSQANYYKQVNQHYENQINKDWLEKFFGLPTTEDYFAVISLLMPNGAYLRVNFKKDYRHTYTIFTADFDKNGIPNNVSSLSVQRANLHEYIHAFTNQLVDKNINSLQKSAETLIGNPKVFELMKDTFYGNWRYLLYESMVRAATIKYLAANEADKSVAENEILKQEKLGFFWIKQLIGELDRYENNRSKYKNIDEFMLKIIEFFRQETEKITQY